MRILYAAMKYDYGRPEQGHSFEHYNFYDALRRMGHEILYFDFMTLTARLGRHAMNRRLIDVAAAEKPALLFSVLFEDEIDPGAIHRISKAGKTVTLNWFCDDHWRFENFSRHYAPNFDWVVTTARSAVPKYERMGYRTAIRSQWACNHHLYRKLDLPLEHAVTFVGQPHGDRRRTIEALRAAGVDVRAFGAGWEAGRLDQDEMIRAFNRSRINLNLSNASAGPAEAADPVAARLKRRVSRSLDATALGRKLKALGKRCLAGLSRTASAVRPGPAAPETPARSGFEQIKGRNFEIPGCGGFLLTSRVEDLESYYEIGEEVVCFEDTPDLIAKVRYYLDHDAERAAIAEAGHRRTLAEHTYAHRFTEIFRRMGLPAPPLETVLAGGVEAGRVVDLS